MVFGITGCCGVCSEREGLGHMIRLLAREGKVFEMLVNSVGQNLVLDGLVTCFLPWALSFKSKEGLVVNWFSSIEIEPGYKLDGCVGMEQVSKEMVSGVR